MALPQKTPWIFAGWDGWDSHELLQALSGRQETFILDQGVPLEKRHGYLWNISRDSRAIPQNPHGNPKKSMGKDSGSELIMELGFLGFIG